MQQEYSRVKEILTSDDPQIIRMTAENFRITELPEQIAKYLAERIVDKNNGIRDSISTTLILNKNPHIPEIVVPYISSPDAATRNLAGEILLAKGSEAVDAMIDYLPKGNDDDHKFIIDLLGLIGDKKAVPSILKVFEETEDDNVILACIEALGNLKAEEGVEKIISAYSKNELFWATVMEALGKIGGDKAVAFMLEKYDEVDELTKFSIVESLGDVGNQDAVDLLNEVISNYNGPLAWAAFESLMKLRSKYDYDIHEGSHLVALANEIFAEGDLKYKIYASQCYKAFADRSVMRNAIKNYGINEKLDEKLESIFFQYSDNFFMEIVDSLSENDEHTGKILELVKNLIANGKAESFFKLEQVEQSKFSNFLVSNLDHHDEMIRLLSMELLFFLVPETALLFIDKMAEDPSPWNKLRLLEIVQNSREPQVVEAIKKLAEDEDEMVKETANNILLTI